VDAPFLFSHPRLCRFLPSLKLNLYKYERSALHFNMRLASFLFNIPGPLIPPSPSPRNFLENRAFMVPRNALPPFLSKSVFFGTPPSFFEIFYGIPGQSLNQSFFLHPPSSPFSLHLKAPPPSSSGLDFCAHILTNPIDFGLPFRCNGWFYLEPEDVPPLFSAAFFFPFSLLFPLKCSDTLAAPSNALTPHTG